MGTYCLGSIATLIAASLIGRRWMSITPLESRENAAPVEVKYLIREDESKCEPLDGVETAE